MIRIINIRENPEWLGRAADYFAARWQIDRALYVASMTESVTAVTGVPRWYVMLSGEKIIGGFGLIENDFMVRTDLCPWLCALYVEEDERGRSLGAKLLAHGRREAAKLGYGKLWLNTDHIGYYEKYGWRYIGNHAHQCGEDTRVYEADAPGEALAEMSDFFNDRADTYDRHMLDDLGLAAFYEAVASCFDAPGPRLLDLGCGTGLELTRLFEKSPDLEVTGIDLSPGMLKQLDNKFPGKRLRLVCGSYFDTDFGTAYDYVLSTYSLHHFTETQKQVLYRKIYDALKPGGLFVWGDYTVSSIEEQTHLALACAELRRQNGLNDGDFYHFDTPFTSETEVRLLREAGFDPVQVERQWDRTTLITAKK